MVSPWGSCVGSGVGGSVVGSGIGGGGGSGVVSPWGTDGVNRGVVNLTGGAGVGSGQIGQHWPGTKIGSVSQNMHEYIKHITSLSIQTHSVHGSETINRSP